MVGFGFLQVVEQVLLAELLFCNGRPPVVAYRPVDASHGMACSGAVAAEVLDVGVVEPDATGFLVAVLVCAQVDERPTGSLSSLDGLKQGGSGPTPAGVLHPVGEHNHDLVLRSSEPGEAPVYRGDEIAEGVEQRCHAARLVLVPGEVRYLADRCCIV